MDMKVILMMEDVGIEDVNIASVSLNSYKRNMFYEINWISFFS